MIRFVVLCLVAALAWMVWWAVGKGAYEQGLAAWVDQQRARGWTATYTELRTVGFPNRFDTTIRDVELTDQATGTGWQVPFVQFLSLSYKPHQVIAVIAPTHRIVLQGQDVDVSQKDARASLFLSPTPSLPLSSARLVASDIVLTSSQGWNLSTTEARFAVSSDPTQHDTYRIGIETTGLSLTEHLRGLVDPGATLPDTIARLHADAWVSLSAPLDRNAFEGTRPRITSIDLSDLSAEWGKSSLSFKGALTFDASGLPSGKVTATAQDWKTLYDLARTAGLIDPAAEENVLNALTLMSRGADSLEAPLTIANGMISLGPVPLASIPRLSGG